MCLPALDRRRRDRLAFPWLSRTQLVRGPLLFWTLYFTVVALSNLTDLLRHLGALPPRWSWVSGNLGFVASSIGRVGVSAGAAAPLLAGVIVWAALAALLFGHATARPWDDTRRGRAFALSLALWGAFIVLDEVLIIFETGAEATHVRLFTAELATLAVIHLLGPSKLEP